MKNKDITLTQIIRWVIFYWVTFVIITWITFWIKGSIPDTLVQFGLGGGAVELFSAALIQIFKKKYEAYSPDEISIIKGLKESEEKENDEEGFNT